jgi:hypothetical protein
LNWPAFCDGYATRAVESVAKNNADGCGLAGPRWDSNRQAHLDFCLRSEGTPYPSAEELARIRELKACKPIKHVGKVKLPEQAGQAGGDPPAGGDQRAGVEYRCAINDVDIYDSPTEPRTVVGTMAQGQKAPYVESHPDGWAKLAGVRDAQKAIGDGWVAEDHIQVCQ